ncbi:MAG: ATP-binding protein [Pseudomonadota bacterium]
MTALSQWTTPLAAFWRGVRQIGLRALFLAIAALALLNLGFIIAATTLGGKQGETLVAPPIVSQAAAAANLMDALEPETRRMALEAINSPTLRLAIRPTFAATPAIEEPAPAFVPIIAAYGAMLGEREFRVYLRSASSWNPLRFARLNDDIIIVMRLADGSGLVVEAGEAFQRAVAVYGMILFFGVISLVLIGFASWAALSYARPLARLAAASEAFSDRIDAGADVPELHETGPKAVRDLAAALNDMRARLRQLMAERMTTLAAIAHDMRTYLTRLRMRCEFIDDAAQREKAVRDLEDMAQLLEDALWLGKSGVENPERARLNVGAWLHDFAARRQELGEPVALCPTTAEDVADPDGTTPLIVEIAPTDLSRALNNLVDNALRYAGEATLSVDAAHEDAIAIDVLDRGPGVPDAFLQRMTDPFIRQEPSRSRDTGGAGLGLAIAKALIERAGGRLRLDNRSLGGFSARIELPRSL